MKAIDRAAIYRRAAGHLESYGSGGLCSALYHVAITMADGTKATAALRGDYRRHVGPWKTACSYLSALPEHHTARGHALRIKILKFLAREIVKPGADKKRNRKTTLPMFRTKGFGR
jgi:hypothetical protein